LNIGKADSKSNDRDAYKSCKAHPFFGEFHILVPETNPFNLLGQVIKFGKKNR